MLTFYKNYSAYADGRHTVFRIKSVTIKQSWKHLKHAYQKPADPTTHLTQGSLLYLFNVMGVFSLECYVIKIFDRVSVPGIFTFHYNANIAHLTKIRWKIQSSFLHSYGTN